MLTNYVATALSDYRIDDEEIEEFPIGRQKWTSST